METPDIPDKLRDLFGAFAIDGDLLLIEPFGTGHINRSFRSAWRTSSGTRRFLHQRINRLVFRDPPGIMENIDRALRHMRHRLDAQGAEDSDRSMLRIVPTRDGSLFLRDDEGEYWRSYDFIEHSLALHLVKSPEEAREIARGAGRFIRLLDGLPGPRLHEAIHAFHDARDRYRRFDAALAADPRGRRREVRREIDVLQAKSGQACVLIEALAAGRIPERVVHNDTKADNVLLDSRTCRALCMVDPDTVGPGSLLYDLGDLVRTAAATTREDDPDPSRMDLDLDAFEAIIDGFLSEIAPMMTDAERALVPEAGRVFALIMGLRFLTDHLEGDRYYRIQHPGQNLERCRTQLALADAIEKRWDEIRRACDRALHARNRP